MVIPLTIVISGASATLPPGLLPIHKNLTICDLLPSIRLPRTAASSHAEQVFIGISAVGNAHRAIFLGPLNLLCLKVDRCSMQIICCPIHITWQSADERMAVWLPKLYSFAKSLALGCDRLQNILSKNPMQGQFQAIKMAHRLLHWGSKSVQLVQCTLYNWSRRLWLCAPPRGLLQPKWKEVTTFQKLSNRGRSFLLPYITLGGPDETDCITFESCNTCNVKRTHAKYICGISSALQMKSSWSTF